MKERSRSRGGRRRSREEEPARRSRREEKRSRPREVKVESVTRPQRRAGEEEAKKPLVRGESMRETPRRKNRDNMPRRESEVSSRTSVTAAKRRHKARGEERDGRQTTRVGRELSCQPSSIASVPMPKSLPSLPSLSQNGGTVEDHQQLSGGFEESQGSNKRDADNPFHRSYSRVRENPVHKESKEEKPRSNTFNLSQGGNTRGEPKILGSFTRRQSGRSLSSLKRVRRLSLGSLTSEEPTGVVRLPPGELEQVPSTRICNLSPAGRVESINFNLFQWSFGGGSLNHSRETVNTAIVDFYQQEDEEPVLKSRVSSCSRWLGWS